MSYVCGATCYHCGKKWPLSKITYTCPDCEGNVELIYDYAKIKQICHPKYFQQNHDYSMWRYQPLLPVNECGMISLQIGWTPLYRVKQEAGVKLYIKDEGRNPSASLKDRASAVALIHARESGAKKVTAASTGNAGSSMSCLSANIGMPAVIFVPRKAPEAKIAQLLIFGARILMVNGTYDDAFDLCLKVSKEFGWYNRNTGYNPYTREGKKTCAMEICEQLGWRVPDWVLVSVGDGNILSGLWKGFRDLKEIGMIDRLPKLAGVQSTTSNAIAQAVERVKAGQALEIRPVNATTIADSISVDLPRDGLAAAQAILNSQGVAVQVSDEEILQAMPCLARQTGVFGEPAGATAFAGFGKMRAMNLLKENETVVCVITGSGLKDVATAIKVAGTGTVIDPTLDAVKKLLSKA